LKEKDEDNIEEIVKHDTFHGRNIDIHIIYMYDVLEVATDNQELNISIIQFWMMQVSSTFKSIYFIILNY